MELIRGSGIAVWRQIVEALKADLDGGVFAPGERLPTEYELAARFQVNRHTLRRALAELEEKGLLRVEQGRGTFVQEPVIHYSITSRTRFSENLSRQSREARGELLGVEIMAPSTEIAAALGLDKNGRVVCVEQAGLADNRSISLASHYFPLPRFSGIGEIYKETGSVTEALRFFGVIDYFRKETKVTARLPSGRDAKLLNQPRSRPVLVSESVNVDLNGSPVEYGIARFSGDWVKLVFEP